MDYSNLTKEELLLELKKLQEENASVRSNLAQELKVNQQTVYALNESEMRFKALHEASFGGIVIHDRCIILECNKGLTEITGYAYKELIGMNGLLLIEESFRDVVMHNIKTGYELPYEARGQRKDGTTYPLRLRARTIPYAGKMVRAVEFRDITEQKKANDSLQETLTLLTNLAEMVPGVVYQYRLYPDGRSCFPYASPGMYEIYEVTPEQVKEDASIVFGRLHPEDLDEITRLILESARNQTLFHVEFRVILPKQGLKWRTSDAKPELLPDGSTLWYGRIMDITDRKIAEEKFRISNEFNKYLLQTIPFGLDIVDLDGKILFANENLRSYFDFDILGKKCWEVYKEDRSQCAVCPLKSGLGIGETMTSESEKILGNRTFLVTHTGMLFEGKEAVLEIFHDVTERREVEQKVKLLAHSLESITECVSITDSSDHLIYVNESFQKTYGYSEKDLLGQHINIVRPADEHTGQPLDILPETRKGGWRGELINVKKDGTKFPVLLSTSVVRNHHDEPIAHIGVALDITELKRNREELIAAKDKAESMNRAKSYFFANMSHEFRTPINGILGMASILKDSLNEVDDPELMLENIIVSGNRLMAVLDTVLVLANIESGSESGQMSVIDLHQLFTELEPGYREKADRKQLTLSFTLQDAPLKLRMSSRNLTLVVNHLVENAIKFTHHGSVEVGVSSENGFIILEVKDSGIGIEKKYLEHIFDEFRQVSEGFSRGYEGSGLGLTLIRKIVTLSSGKIEVESEPGKGSCFKVLLPEYREAATPVAPKVHARSTSILTPPRIKQELPNVLLVEDNVINQMTVELYLRNLCVLDKAFDGPEALKLAMMKRCELILMDINLGVGMTGVEASKEIRNIRGYENTPIIAVTGYAMDSDIREFLAEGLTSVLPKPFEKKEIIELIHTYLPGSN